jgi:hypothetical protein
MSASPKPRPVSGSSESSWIDAAVARGPEFKAAMILQLYVITLQLLSGSVKEPAAPGPAGGPGPPAQTFS